MGPRFWMPSLSYPISGTLIQKLLPYMIYHFTQLKDTNRLYIYICILVERGNKYAVLHCLFQTYDQ